MSNGVTNMTERQTVYVSITGLRIKRPWHTARFMWHAVRSMGQAKGADGNVSAESRTIDSVHHTLTVWRSERDMRAFLVSGAHAQAMKAYPSIGTGMTFGFETDRVPSWDEVPALWRAKGREV